MAFASCYRQIVSRVCVPFGNAGNVCCCCFQQNIPIYPPMDRLYIMCADDFTVVGIQTGIRDKVLRHSLYSDTAAASAVVQYSYWIDFPEWRSKMHQVPFNCSNDYNGNGMWQWPMPGSICNGDVPFFSMIVETQITLHSWKAEKCSLNFDIDFVCVFLSICRYVIMFDGIWCQLELSCCRLQWRPTSK